MPRFNYTAISVDGKKVKGTVTSESPYAARKQLRSKGMHPSSVREFTSQEERKAAFLSLVKKGGKKQILDFTQQMATLLSSGIKLTESLSVLTLQVSNEKFKNAVIDIRDRVVGGESFADALGARRDRRCPTPFLCRVVLPRSR